MKKIRNYIFGFLFAGIVAVYGQSGEKQTSEEFGYLCDLICRIIDGGTVREDLVAFWDDSKDDTKEEPNAPKLIKALEQGKYRGCLTEQDPEGNTLLHIAFEMLMNMDFEGETAIAFIPNFEDSLIESLGRLLNTYTGVGNFWTIQNNNGDTVLDIFFRVGDCRLGGVQSRVAQLLIKKLAEDLAGMNIVTTEYKLILNHLIVALVYRNDGSLLEFALETIFGENLNINDIARDNRPEQEQIETFWDEPNDQTMYDLLAHARLFGTEEMVNLLIRFGAEDEIQENHQEILNNNDIINGMSFFDTGSF